MLSPEGIRITYTQSRKTVFSARLRSFYSARIMKKPLVEKMASIRWQKFPGHFGGALSKALIGPENADSKLLDFRISRYAPNAYVPPGVRHSLTNTGLAGLVFLVVTAPAVDEASFILSDGIPFLGTLSSKGVTTSPIFDNTYHQILS
jgi:hypothetical protein